jgi:hypothetical protein
VDRVLDSFERDFLTAIKDKIITEPFQAHSDRLEEVQQAIKEAQDLIRGYLGGNPKDIYGLKIQQSINTL